MKRNISALFTWFKNGLVEVVQKFPLEVTLTIYSTVIAIIASETNDDNLSSRVLLLPLFFIIILFFNIFTFKRKFRFLYWLSIIPIIPLSIWGGEPEWVKTFQFWGTTIAFAPLLLFLSKRYVDNKSLVKYIFSLITSVFSGLIMAFIAYGLFCALFYSTVYIFKFDGEWTSNVQTYAFIITTTFLTPILFLMFFEKTGDKAIVSNRFFDILLNYIVTPALLIYIIILYVYIVKIIIIWELPSGGLANMVFTFVLSAMIVKAIQLILAKPIYTWFFNRMSWYVCPIIILFWIGASRRVIEYGFTEWRYVMMVCGIVMTLYLILFSKKKWAHYFYVLIASLFITTLVCYVPVLNPKTVSVQSQMNRVINVANQLNCINDEGKLINNLPENIDSIALVKYKQLYQSVLYLSMNDSTAFRKFGLDKSDDLLNGFTENQRQYIRYYHKKIISTAKDDIHMFLPSNSCINMNGNYVKLYTKIVKSDEAPVYRYANDSIYIYNSPDTNLVWKTSKNELLIKQLDKAKYDITLDKKPSEEQILSMLEIDELPVRIILKNLKLTYDENTNQWTIKDLSIENVMIKELTIDSRL